MKAPILALLGRSLRLDSRALHLYLMRLALLVFIFFSLIGAHVASLRVGAPGLSFFSPIVVINLLFISLAAVGYFSSVITEEKEEMTLGLLRLTGLNALGILLGKSTSRLIGGLMLLLAQIPFTLLAVTLGGVSLRQVFAAYATLMAYTIFLANLALLASVVARNTVRAGVAMLLGMLAFLLVGPIGTAALGSWTSAASDPAVAVPLRLCEWLHAANPFVRTAEIMRTGFNGHPVGFQVISNLGLGLACFVASWALFGFATREQQAAAPARGFVRPRTSRIPLLRLERPWRNAIAWKEFHFLTGGRAMILGRFLLLGAGTVGVVALFAGFGGPMPLGVVGGLMMVLPVVLAPLELVAHGSRTFREEVNWHTLPDLMLLPVSPSRLVLSKLLGFLPVLIPYGACFVLGAVLAAVADPDGFAEGALFLLRTGLPWYLLANLVAFVHFVVLVSLFVKRAALPVASVIWLIGAWRLQGSFLGIFALGALGSLIFCTVMAMLLAIVTGLIHWGICARLDRIAGD